MRAVIQRVLNASVSIDNQQYSAINKGLLVLLCVEVGDMEQDMDYIEKKLLCLRIFSDENGKLNKSIMDIGGEMLLVSQFTLAGDARKGTRPSYSDAAQPDVAIPMYEQLIKRLGEHLTVKTGVFGADMQVGLVNDGPVTIILDSRKRM